MCGIVGIIQYKPQSTNIDIEELLLIRDSMEKRGPDGAGLWVSKDNRVALAHRRLEIIGLGEQGIQPMILENGCSSQYVQVVITYNGEIYNYKELRAELQTLGHKFKSNTDTEVILHLYEEFGEGFQTKLRGMFAFILVDSFRSIILLVRDPLGIKPLYYHDENGILTVASQAKALLKSKRISKRTDDGALAGLFIFGSIPEPLTAWKEIKAVPSGAVLKFNSNGEKQIDHYFSLATEIKNAENLICSEFNLDLFRTELIEDIKAHMVSDVEVGIFLSSGIDSTSILGMASNLVPNLNSITLGFKDFEGLHSDEVPVAIQVSELYGSRNIVRRISGNDFINNLPKILSDMDQPSVDGVNTWLVANVAAELDLKVALSGIGGDEFFGGYSTFVNVPSMLRKINLVKKIFKNGELIRKLSAPLFKNNNPKAAGILEYGDSLEKMWLLNRCVMAPWELANVLGKERANEALKELNIDGILNTASPLNLKTEIGKISALEGGLYMKNQLLRDADWAGMGNSLEIRVPFVDSFLLPTLLTRLIHHWAPETKKNILAQIPSPFVPDSVVNRGKTGFSLPMEKWISINDEYSSWKSCKALSNSKCTWARRWAYVIADYFEMI